MLISLLYTVQLRKQVDCATVTLLISAIGKETVDANKHDLDSMKDNCMLPSSTSTQSNGNVQTRSARRKTVVQSPDSILIQYHNRPPQLSYALDKYEQHCEQLRTARYQTAPSNSTNASNKTRQQPRVRSSTGSHHPANDRIPNDGNESYQRDDDEPIVNSLVQYLKRMSRSPVSNMLINATMIISPIIELGITINNEQKGEYEDAMTVFMTVMGSTALSTLFWVSMHDFARAHSISPLLIIARPAFCGIPAYNGLLYMAKAYIAISQIDAMSTVAKWSCDVLALGGILDLFSRLPTVSVGRITQFVPREYVGVMGTIMVMLRADQLMGLYEMCQLYLFMSNNNGKQICQEEYPIATPNSSDNVFNQMMISWVVILVSLSLRIMTPTISSTTSPVLLNATFQKRNQLTVKPKRPWYKRFRRTSVLKMICLTFALSKSLLMPIKYDTIVQETSSSGSVAPCKRVCVV
jgi:hypothetical protein